VKDEGEAHKEAKKFRNIFTRFLKLKADPQTGEAINKIEVGNIGEGISKQLMDVIQLIKFIDEDYSKFIGEPSAGHKRQSLSGEFASGSSQWIYEYNKFSKRVDRYLDEIKEKFGINVVTDKDIQPTNFIADLQNGGEKNKKGKVGNENAEKENPTTSDIKDGVKDV
jgi:hypothetical protein